MHEKSDLYDRIVHGDCLEAMENIPDRSIDLILSDLPYGVTARNKWDKIIPFEPLWKVYRRIIKDDGAIVLTAVQPFTSKLVMSAEDIYRYEWIWKKNKKTGFLNAKKMPLRAHENILVFYKELPTYNPQKTTGHKPVNSFTKHTGDGTNYGETKKGLKGGGQTDRYPTSVIEIAYEDCETTTVLEIPVVNNDSKDKYHPTQKPLELFEYLIKTYTNPDELVLDNCLGSGTTAIAARRTGRRFYGIEADPDNFDMASKRLKAHNIALNP